MNDFMTAVLREYVLKNPELHKMTLTDEEVKAMEPLTLRRCFYTCGNCQRLLLSEDELFSFEFAMKKSAEAFFEHVDFLTEAFGHRCPAVEVPVVAIVAVPEPPVESEPIDWQKKKWAERCGRQRQRWAERHPVAAEPIETIARTKPICDLRAIAERRALRMSSHRNSDVGTGIEAGTRFGSVVVLGRISGSGTRTRYAVRCDCGTEATSGKSWLVDGWMTRCKTCHEKSRVAL